VGYIFNAEEKRYGKRVALALFQTMALDIQTSCTCGRLYQSVVQGFGIGGIATEHTRKTAYEWSAKITYFASPSPAAFGILRTARPPLSRRYNQSMVLKALINQSKCSAT
jgi:hypothetical protein